MKSLDVSAIQRVPSRLSGPGDEPVLKSYALTLLAVACLRVQAQSQLAPSAPQPFDTSLRRVEIGARVSGIRTGCIGQTYCNLPELALGIDGTVNLNQHFAIDVSGDTSPSVSNGASILTGGHVSEFLVGTRAEVRAKHYGFFLEARPGVFTWSRAITGVSFPTPSTIRFSYGAVHHFVSDVGAGLEYSPASRVHVRLEVSDLILRDSSVSWRNNLHPTAGVYWGLGKPVSWKPPVYYERAAHPFFGRTNVVLISGSVLGMAADSITTQRFISQGISEGDPFARPLVKYGWSGQISLVAVEVGAETLGMYGLHRIGQHWIEKLVPVCVATTHGIFAYNNSLIDGNKR